MDLLFERTFTDGRHLTLTMTGADDPDLSTLQEPEVLEHHQQQVCEGDWSWLRQVHSDRTLTVHHRGQHAGAHGDALVTDMTDAVLAVQVADCVPIGLVSDSGAFAVVHSGWRGAFNGVIESAVRALRSLADEPGVTAVVGPHICARCYEFGTTDLAHMEQRFGAGVKATTRDGTPALDMAAVVAGELNRLGVGVEKVDTGCTSCTGTYWSHRARQERGRQAIVGTVRQP